MKIILALAFLAVAAAVRIPTPKNHLFVKPPDSPEPVAEEDLYNLLREHQASKNIRRSPGVVEDFAATVEQPMPVLVTDRDIPIGQAYARNIDIRPMIVPPEVLAQVAAELEHERKIKKTQNQKAPVDRMRVAEDSPMGYAQVDRVRRVPDHPEYFQPMNSHQQQEEDLPVFARLPQIIRRFIGPPLEEGIIPEPVRIAESPLASPYKVPDIQQELPELPSEEQSLKVRPGWERPPEYNGNPFLRSLP